jgi:hypothetical protein
MAARIPISWVILLLILGVFAFFGYQILQASSNSEAFPPYSPDASAHSSQMRGPSPQYEQAPQQPSVNTLLKNAPAESGSYDDGAAPVVMKQAPIPNNMPNVPGQTEEDLRAPEPLQATPPSVQYDAPEATDPLNRNVFMSSEFGSNLRHPEQMIEHRPANTMGGVVNSGLGSQYSSPGGNRSTGFAPEMAQNGGEFMQGIGAFDSSDVGSAFSML